MNKISRTMERSVYAQLNELRRVLKWEVEITTDDTGIMRIECDHISRKHTIFLPHGFDVRPPKNAFRLLHEYCHAELTENVDVLYGAKSIVPRVKNATVAVTEDEELAIGNCLMVADDWFAEAVLCNHCPSYFKHDLARLLDMAKRIPNMLPAYMMSLLVAQGAFYLNYPLFGNDTVQSLATCFLQVTPHGPSPDALRKLWTDLLRVAAPRCSDLLDIEPVNGDEANEKIPTPTEVISIPV